MLDRSLATQTEMALLNWKALLAASLGAGLAGILAFGSDSTLASAVRGWDLPGDLAKAVELSEAFAHGFGAAAILGAVLLVAVDRRKLVYLGILITVLSGVSANLAKAGFVRIRPHQVGTVVVASDSDDRKASAANLAGAETSASGVEIAKASFWDARQRSFPSGHAATAWGLAIGLAVIFPRGKYLFGVLALLASLQRVVSGAHYPSDVLAGAAIALFCGGCVIALYSGRGGAQRALSIEKDASNEKDAIQSGSVPVPVGTQQAA